MVREEKITYARSYTAELVVKYKGIAGVVLGGSVARGNDLPISDIDICCFIDDDQALLPIEKHAENNLYIDIDQRRVSELTEPDFGDDSYFCGYMHDALVLYDRDGDIAKCQASARENLSSSAHREKQLTSLRESVERNRNNLMASAKVHNAREACRASIFAAWSLSDLMLVARGISPGGARGLSRLSIAWPEAADAIITFEGFATLEESQIARLVDCYRGIADTGSFFTIWFEKVKWMLVNGYRPDAFHALWIALGLRIKDAKVREIGVSTGDLERACSQWLDTIDWNWDTVKHKAVELENLTDRFCH